MIIFLEVCFLVDLLIYIRQEALECFQIRNLAEARRHKSKIRRNLKTFKKKKINEHLS